MRAEISLETIGKALIILAVVVILLFIFRKLIGQSGDNIEKISDKSGEQASSCLEDPAECEWWGETADGSDAGAIGGSP